MKRLLITGAAGGVGRMLRKELQGRYPVLRLSDIADMGPARDGEEIMPCDLSDAAAVEALVEGCDAIVHLGGISLEDSFDNILQANIRGTYNVYEAARKHGRPRILFASSNHATGFHLRETRLDATSPLRPDSMYGVSKCFGEALSRYYFDQYAIETLCLRIGFCFPEPKDRRSMAIWLGIGDLGRLVDRMIRADRVGHTIVYGSSDNAEKWWDNRHAAFLGWQPQESSEPFRDKVEAATAQGAFDAAEMRHQGGIWAARGHFEYDWEI